MWERRFDRRADAIGRVLTLDEKPCPVVGVMARGFQVPGQRDDEVWVRVPLDPPKRRGGYYIHVLVRVPTGVTADQAAARLTAVVTPLLRERFGVKDTDTWRYGLRPERERLVGDIRETLLMLFCGVSLVLLVAVVNVANLMLARGTFDRELAVRASLGARKGRLARQLLTESALLGLLGGALGLGIAAFALDVAGTAASAVIPRMNEVRLDPVVVAFALALGLGAGLVAGVLPVARLPWTRLGTWLRDGGRTTGEGAHPEARGALVVAEIALTLMVLTGSALLGKSLLRAQYQDPGFRSQGVLTFLLSLPEDRYKPAERTGTFLTSAVERCGGVLGVVDVAAASSLPPDLLTFSNNYTVEGQTPNTAGPNDVADWNMVTPSYFRTLRIGLVAGREFDGHDLDTSPAVALVNEAFVRRHIRTAVRSASG